MSSSVREFIENSSRILKLARKPGRKEFSDTMKISLLGFAIIGTIGFFIQLIATVLLSGG